jgi:hypothetical protein
MRDANGKDTGRRAGLERLNRDEADFYDLLDFYLLTENCPLVTDWALPAPGFRSYCTGLSHDDGPLQSLTQLLNLDL